MGYYCNECKKTISAEEFSYSINRYHKALLFYSEHAVLMFYTTLLSQHLLTQWSFSYRDVW